jgi:hypothetical protein
MKNRSRLAILAAALLLGGASIVAAGAANVPATPAAPGAAQQEQTGEQADAAENQAGDQVGHQDVPGTPDQTGDNQD